MSVIYRQIYMTEKMRVEPINVVSDCKIPIVLDLMDYDIASGALVKAYATEAYGSLTYAIDCDVDGNQISFVAPHGFFSPGYNLLQIEISGKFIPYAITVVCEYRLSDVGNAPGLKPIEPPATETTITERTIAEWGFTKNTGNYNKPANGIPETDLSPEVCEKLNAVPTIDDIPSNIVIYEETEGSEDAITVETLLLDKLTMDADDQYIYLRYGDVVLGKVSAGAGGSSGPGTVYCTAIAIDQSDLQFIVEDTGEHILTATIYPADCTQIAKWSSSDTNVATITNNGVLTIVGIGTTTITVKCGSQSDTMTVTIVDNHIKPIYIRAGISLNVTASAYTVYNQGTRGYSYYGVITDSSYDQYKQIIPITAGKKYTIYFADGAGLPEEYAPWLRVMQFSGRTRKTATEWIKTPYTFTADSGNDGVAWNLLIGGVNSPDDVTQPNVSTYETWINDNMRIKEVQ